MSDVRVTGMRGEIGNFIDHNFRRAHAGSRCRDCSAEIHRLADDGNAVVVISSYLPEILAVSDRILVARTGQIVAELNDEEAT